LLAVILGESILTLLYGNNFIAFKNTLIIAAGANLFFALQAVGGIALTSFGIFKYQMICMMCTVPIGYFSSEYFVINYGVDGALYSGILCAFVISTSFIIRLIYELNKYEKN
jgi:O-antigen/teichoic acid export membrane protein